MDRAGENQGRATAVHTYPDAASACAALAERICASATRAINRRGRCFLVLSGGRSPHPLFKLLSAAPYRDAVDWSRTDFFWTDERAVPKDHPESNYRMAHELLLGPLQIPRGRVHRIHAEDPGVKGARRYESELYNCFNANRRALFDVTLLGLGADGHTASLFPHTTALSDVRHSIAINEVPQLQTTRVTMTAPRINGSREIFFLVYGADKAAAVAAVLQGPNDPLRFPAQLIRPEHGPLEWFLDAAAASGCIER